MANASFDLTELNGSNGFVINGIGDVGKSVSGAGDVNGDGIADLIVGAPGANQSYVIFGNANGFGANFELSTLDGSNGFILNDIDSSSSSFYSDISVSTAGDINDDGIDDVIIGAPWANQSYVVFGSTAGFNPSLDVTALDGSNGFAINGINGVEIWDELGFSVSTAGDINNDGIDDVIIGAPEANQSYVIFGNASGFGASFDLSTLDGSNGFVLNGIESEDKLGFSVSTVGDINNDGIDDLVVEAPGANRSYVVFGNAGGFVANVDLSALDGSNGFAINWFDWFGSVNGVGDVNGDGIDDLAIGGSPEGYVVFGRTDGFNANFDLSALDGDNGFAISGAGGFSTYGAGGFSTYLVSGAGDINGDGFADLIVGDFNDSTGKAHVLFGGTGIGSSSEFNLSYSYTDDQSTLNGSNGFVIDGIDTSNASGFPVSDAGDVNGDGLDDLIIGDPDANQSYVLYGNTAPELDLNGGVAGKNFVANFTGTAVSIVDSANLILTDSNNTTLTGATITIANLFDGEAENLAVDTTGTNITASYDSATGMLTLTGEDAVANYRQVFQTVTYNNTAAAPNTTYRIIEFEVDDGAAHSNTSKVTTTTLAFGSGDPSLVVFYGINAYDGTGVSVSGAGDINGDGFDDFLIGAPLTDPNGQERAGSSYVVFGTADGFSAGFELSTLDGSNGFIINGLDGEIDDSFGVDYSRGDVLGASVSSAGDINGDGFDDIVVGAPGSDPNGVNEAGASYVVFGQATGFSATLDLTTLDGSSGFVINGLNEQDRLGRSVSSAGDVNGDGFDDLIIGISSTDPNGVNGAGASYVVFGQAAGFSATLDLTTLDGSNGFVINGINEGDASGYSVSSAGDVNGDGLDDLFIGAPFADPNGINRAGASYVVFGQAAGFNATFDLATLDGSNGFVINGIDEQDWWAGHLVNLAGDINGDGFDDIVISKPYADPNGVNEAGSSYVVFGGNSFEASFDLSDLDGNNGFAINGANEYDSLGSSVSTAGDVNGDGFDDLIIGSPGASPDGRLYPGSSYVVFGKAGGFSATLNPLTLDGSSGFVLNGLEEFDLSGVSVSAAGDVNGDGVDDLIIGAPERNPNFYATNPIDRVDVGKGYLVFGNAAPELDLNGGAEGIDLTATFTDSPVPIVDAANLTLTDLNDTTLSGATVTITNLFDGAAEVLAADITGTNITANYDATTGTLSLSGEDTLTNYQQILETLTYNNTAETPDTTDRIIEFVIDDGGYHSHTSAVATTTLAFDTASNGESLTLGQTIATQSNSLPAISAIELFSSEVPVEPIAGIEVTAIADGLV